MQKLPFPKSFPNKEELFFLSLLLSDDDNFPVLYEEWKNKVVLDDIDYATLRLLPLLYLRLQKFNFKDETTAKIRGVYKLTWVKNQLLISAIEQVVPVLETQGISVLMLKGVPLLMSVYKDVGARFLGDADILIPPGNIKKVLKIMSDAGWKLEGSRNPKYDNFSEESLQRATKAANFINEQEVKLDIHWRLFRFSKDGGGVFAFDDLWSRSTTINFKNQKYNILSPEDMLMHVIIHGAGGNTHRPFRWVADAVAIIKALDIDWDKLLKEIKEMEYVVGMYVGFSFLLQHKFITLPDFFCSRPLDYSIIGKGY